MDAILKNIIAGKKPCYFISPHLDDAVLSCGDLMAYLAKKKIPVTVITVFTEAGQERETLSAKKAVSLSGFPSAQSLYAARRQEDKVALKALGVQGKYLGEVEALWRRKLQPYLITKLLGAFLPEFIHVYPTYRLHIASGKLAKADKETVTRISRKLKRLLPEGAIVFAPHGIGAHVDHLVTREAVVQVTTPVLWYDQPYYFREHGVKGSPKRKNTHEFRSSTGKKPTIANYYRTQMPTLFSAAKMPELREFYTTDTSA